MLREVNKGIDAPLHVQCNARNESGICTVTF